MTVYTVITVLVFGITLTLAIWSISRKKRMA